MMPLTDEEISFMKSKKNVVYAKKSFVVIKMREINLNYTKKLQITAVTLETLEELLIVFIVSDRNYLNKFL